MKIALLLLTIFTINTSSAQHEHGLKTGIDSIAAHHGIHEKLTYSVWFPDSIPDTGRVQIHTYDELGRIIQFEEYKYTNKYFRKLQSPLKQVYFEYNAEGYLISEQTPIWPVYVTSPVYQNDTLYQKKVETYRTGRNIYLIDRQSIETTDKNGNIRSKSYTSFHYSPDNQLEMTDNTYSYTNEQAQRQQVRYTYSKRGLRNSLTKQNVGGKFYMFQELYDYIFFD